MLQKCLTVELAPGHVTSSLRSSDKVGECRQTVPKPPTSGSEKTGFCTSNFTHLSAPRTFRIPTDGPYAGVTVCSDIVNL